MADATQPVAQTDALGGAGSLSADLQSIAVNGLSRAIDGVLSTKYPLTSLNETYGSEGFGAFEPGGTLVPKSAPGQQPTGTAPLVQSPVSLFQNPIVLGIAAIAVVVIIIAVAK